MDALIIILTGALVAINGGLLGTFLILRRMAMVGDAISHAVLPGIVIAFMVTQGRESIPMMVGAVALGVITTFLIEFFHRKGRLQEDAAIGVTFTWLFALGVIMISWLTRTANVDIDQDCVLYGEIIYVSLDRVYLANGTDLGPEALWMLGGSLLIILSFLIFGYKELKLTTFDPGYAKSIGINVQLWHYALMSMVSLTTVASFNSVGSILVVAFLIAPAATAYLLTDKLLNMLIISCIVGILAAISGYYLAWWVDGSVSGAMSATAGLLFTLALLFSPSQGIIRAQRLKLKA
jgi:manganese/zinc/iron transport system permease protein